MSESAFAILEEMDRRERARRHTYLGGGWLDMALLSVVAALGPEPKRRCRHPLAQIPARPTFTSEQPLTKRQRRRQRGKAST